jgi:hypothetical protein
VLEAWGLRQIWLFIINDKLIIMIFLWIDYPSRGSFSVKWIKEKKPQIGDRVIKFFREFLGFDFVSVKN